MDTSTCESDFDDGTRRTPANRYSGRVGGRGDEAQSGDISEKLCILADALEGTSKNMSKVDRALGQWRRQTDGQAEEIAQLKDGLARVHSQIQMLGRSNGVRNVSSSASTLHSSDLETDGQRAHPTSHLRDCNRTSGRRRRSHSAGVHFKDTRGTDDNIHTVQQSLMDLHFDQQRLSSDLDREILRRNRSAIETRRAIENLAGHIMTFQTQVPSHVEHRLHEHEREMCTDNRSTARQRRPDQQAAVSDELNEVDQELEKTKRLLKQSEDKRQSLIFQSEELHSELMRTRREMLELQKAYQETTQHGNHVKTDYERLKKEAAELHAQLDKVLEATRENESSQAQLKALRQQADVAHRELAEIRHRLVQREEEIHCKDIELCDSQQRQLALELEIQEVRGILATQEQKIEDQDKLRATLKQIKSENAHVSQQLAEMVDSNKAYHKALSEQQAKLTAVQEERSMLRQQLQLQKEAHQRELHKINCTLKLCQQERDEIQTEMSKVQAEAASDKELCGRLHIKVDRMKNECDKMAEQLKTKDEAYAFLQRKYFQLDEKVRRGEQSLASEALLASIGEEIDAACRILYRNDRSRLKARPQKLGLVKDPHLWLAEAKNKLQWLREEIRESELRQRLQLQQSKHQMSVLTENLESEKAALLGRLDQQEQLMKSLSTEKTELLEKICQKEEHVNCIQERMSTMETTMRRTMEHWESIPEQNLLEDLKDLEESQWQRDLAEQRYNNYKEMVIKIQHQLDESKRKLQEYQQEKLDTSSRSLRLAALSSSIKDRSTSHSSSLQSGTQSTNFIPSDVGASTVNRAGPFELNHE